MTTPETERRRHDRLVQGLSIEVIVGDVPIRARLGDISYGGLRLHVDPEALDFVRAKIEAVRIDGSPPLGVKVVWGFYDGTLGAAFKNPAAALPVVTRLLDRHQGLAEAG